jgi:hypothetical protein
MRLLIPEFVFESIEAMIEILWSRSFRQWLPRLLRRRAMINLRPEILRVLAKSATTLPGIICLLSEPP